MLVRTCAAVLFASFVLVCSVGFAAPIAGPIVWLDAQDIDNDGNSLNNPTLGTPVSNWVDKSSVQGSQNATQLTGSLQPTYTPNFQNGQAAINFNNDILDTPSFEYGTFTIFTAFRSNAGATLLYERGATTNTFDGEYLSTSTGSTLAIRRGTQRSNKEYVANWGNSASILTSTHTFNGTHAGHQLYVNGNLVTLTDAGSLTNDPGIGLVNTPMHIGARTGQVVPLNGDISEMLVYGSALNQAATRIVNNYLSSKYNAPMALPVNNDRYNYDAPGIDYDFNVFGIGREADGTQSSGSFGTGLTLTEANSSLSVGEYLLAGRTLTAPNGLVSSDLAGTGVEQRLGRVWALDKTGTLDATITFNLADLGVSLSADSNFSLLYRSGISGNFSDLGLIDSVVGTNVSFTVLNASLLDGFYTLGVSPPAPEPSSLLLLGCGAMGLSFRSRRRKA